MLDGLGQAADRDHRHAAERRGLPGVGRRQQDFADAGPPAEIGDGQAAAHRADFAVQAELAADEAPLEHLLGDVLVRREHPESDGEIEVVALLPQIRGGKVDDDGFRRQVEPAVLDRGSHPLAALLHRGVGEPYDLHLRQSVVDVDLDLNRPGFDSPGGGSGRSG